MTRDEFMEIAWRDFIMWAASSDDMQAAYTAATGRRMLPAALNAFEAAIDEATGVRESEASDFVLWVTKNHWGMDEAPEKYRLAHQGVAA